MSNFELIPMLKKIFFGVIFILIIYLSNLVTHNYTVNLIKNDYDIVIKDCFINKEKSSNIKIDIIKEENGFITKIKNESDCYNLEKLELKIESLNKGSADTVYININKKIPSYHSAEILVNDIKSDSFKLLEYRIIDFSF